MLEVWHTYCGVQYYHLLHTIVVYYHFQPLASLTFILTTWLQLVLKFCPQIICRMDNSPPDRPSNLLHNQMHLFSWSALVAINTSFRKIYFSSLRQISLDFKLFELCNLFSHWCFWIAYFQFCLRRFQRIFQFSVHFVFTYFMQFKCKLIGINERKKWMMIVSWWLRSQYKWTRKWILGIVKLSL